MKTTDYWTNDKDGYLERNRHLSHEGLTSFFFEALGNIKCKAGRADGASIFADVESVCEYGCNVGLNLRALRGAGVKLYGFDLNPEAVKIAKEIDGVTAEVGNLLEAKDGKYDLVLTKGLLIHIHPDDIETAYRNLYNMTGSYLLICEYYNPTPVEVEYHGKSGLLFKRDFAGDMLDRYPDLKLIDYGFRYRRDEYPQDDISWFLLRKE